MIVTISIKYLQCLPLEKIVDRFLPTASSIHILYGFQWLTVLAIPSPPNVNVYRIPAEHKEAPAYFVDCVKDVDKDKGPDKLLVIDSDVPWIHEILANQNITIL
jgi:hypothetical protein